VLWDERVVFKNVSVFLMLAIWNHFVRNNAKSFCCIVVINIVHILVLTGTSQTSVVEDLSESGMDHLTIVLMNTVLIIMNQLAFVLMETGMLCFALLFVVL